MKPADMHRIKTVERERLVFETTMWDYTVVIAVGFSLGVIIAVLAGFIRLAGYNDISTIFGTFGPVVLLVPLIWIGPRVKKGAKVRTLKKFYNIDRAKAGEVADYFIANPTGTDADVRLLLDEPDRTASAHP